MWFDFYILIKIIFRNYNVQLQHLFNSQNYFSEKNTEH